MEMEKLGRTVKSLCASQRELQKSGGNMRRSYGQRWGCCRSVRSSNFYELWKRRQDGKPVRIGWQR